MENREGLVSSRKNGSKKSKAKEIKIQVDQIDPPEIESHQQQPIEVISNLPNEFPLLYPRTDLGNAEWFAKKFKGKIKYDHQRGRWLIYSSPLWKIDDTEEIILKIKDALRERRAAAEQIADPDMRGKEITWSLSSENSHRIKSMLQLAKSEKTIKTKGIEWDSEGFYLGCKNGVVDLRKGELLPASPEYLVTMNTGHEFKPKASCNEWEKFLRSIWPDEELFEFIWKSVGYSLTGDVREEVLFALFGAGANGKSTFTETLTACFGDYAHTMPFSAIEFKDRSQISNDVASLLGKRLVIASEAQENTRLNEGRIKQLTGGNSVKARFLYQEGFIFQPVCKIWLEANHKPKITDDTDGIWRRLMMLELAKQFKGKDRDKTLKLRLKSKESLEGILAWCVKGALKWMQEGLEPPAKILEGVEAYKHESNPLLDFLDDRCVMGDPEYRVPNSTLWEEYIEWVKMNGEKYPLGRTTFKQRLESMGLFQRGYGEDRTKNWFGITLKTLLKSFLSSSKEKRLVN